VALNEWVTKMGTNCKLHMDNQWMKTYMLNLYIIHVKCVIVLNHHLQLDMHVISLIYVTTRFLVIDFHCNLFMIENYNCKLTIFFIVNH
jgi:hypothetical protein